VYATMTAGAPAHNHRAQLI